jgi:hypothetical protein
MSHIYDRDSFRKGVHDAGDTACRNAPAGYFRDDFQKSFREGVRSAGSYAGYTDSVLDATALVVPGRKPVYPEVHSRGE